VLAPVSIDISHQQAAESTHMQGSAEEGQILRGKQSSFKL
jgi:hypothetical protein